MGLSSLLYDGKCAYITQQSGFEYSMAKQNCNTKEPRFLIYTDKRFETLWRVIAKPLDKRLDLTDIRIQALAQGSIALPESHEKIAKSNARPAKDILFVLPVEHGSFIEARNLTEHRSDKHYPMIMHERVFRYRFRLLA